MSTKIIAAAIILSLSAAACSTKKQSGTSMENTVGQKSAPSIEAKDLSGPTTRDEVLAYERWSDAFGSTTPDDAQVERLKSAPEGATVEVYLGAWCGDSVREVTRFWKAEDKAGALPFEVTTVALDRTFSSGSVDTSTKGLMAVPTFIVMRDGKEVGRVVETAPNSIERDLADLLHGTASGVLGTQ